jgi:hypothetical protein
LESIQIVNCEQAPDWQKNLKASWLVGSQEFFVREVEDGEEN